MKFGSYLASKLPFICAVCLTAVVIGILTAVQKLSVGFVLFLEAAILLPTIIWLITDFCLRKKRYDKLKTLIAQLDEKYLLGELINKPADSVELYYYEIMKSLSEATVGTIETLQRDKRDYEQLVEGWIHEIKTPLTACSLILKNDANPAKLKRELKRADVIAENILYYARLTTAHKDTLLRSVKVQEVIKSSLLDLLPLLTAADIGAEVEGDFSVMTDDKALGFILSQLLCNAAKYCPACHIKFTAENGKIIYEDNGIGIPTHDLPRVTERGFTGTNGRMLANSTGMGLYLVSETCKRFGITLTIESEVNKFTRIILEFDSLTKP